MKSISIISKMIDHSLLHPTFTDEFLRSECKLARELDVASVCIKPCAIGIARETLSGSNVRICTVVGFPHGAVSIEMKIAEVEWTCKAGASEIDFVVNIGKVLGRDWKYASREIGLINSAVVSFGAISKVIFENDYYDTDDYKTSLCEICNEHRVAFVKTSTGYGFFRQKDGSYTYRGATEHDIKLMREKCSPEIQVKAAGGIRTLEDVLRVRGLGATRVGATATKSIIAEAIKSGYS
jgi:deoxyribose-phosphate aldolase